MHIDEADENAKGERTFGVVSATGYIVVTESLDDSSLRAETIQGTATDEEFEGAKRLVRDRIGLMPVWYVKDAKGVASILLTEKEGKESLSRHRRFIEGRRGKGELLTKVVPSKDWDDELVTIHTIENY